MNSTEASRSVLAHMPPTWRQPRDIDCPGCGHNLRGLREEQCTECSLRLAWNQLLVMRCPRCGRSLANVNSEKCPDCRLGLNWPALFESTLSKRSDFFEHAGRSFLPALRTLRRLILPWQFWSEVPMELVVVEPRLKAFRRCALLTGGAICAAMILLFAIPLAMAPVPVRSIFPALVVVLQPTALFVAVGVLPPLVTFAIISRLSRSLANARIDPRQVLRCQAYAFAGCVYLAINRFLAIGLSYADDALSSVGSVHLINPLSLPVVFVSLRRVPVLLGLVLHGESGTTPATLRLIAEVAVLLGGTLLHLAFYGVLIWFWCYLGVCLRRYLRFSARETAAIWVATQFIVCLILGPAGVWAWMSWQT